MINIEVKSNKVPLVIGILVTLIFGIFTVVTLVIGLSELNIIMILIVSFGFGSFTLLGVYLILNYMRRRLIMNGEKLYYTSTIKSEKSFSVYEIQTVRIFQKGTDIQYRLFGDHDEKLAAFEDSMICSHDLLEILLVDYKIPIEMVNPLTDGNLLEKIKPLSESEQRKEQDFIRQHYAPDTVRKESQLIRNLNWVLTIALFLFFFLNIKYIFGFALFIIGLNWTLYLWFYPKMVFIPKKSEMALRIPLLWIPTILSFLVLIPVTETVYIVNDLNYLMSIILIGMILILSFALTVYKKAIKVNSIKKISIGLTILSISFITCIPLHYVLTFDKPIHEEVIVIDKHKYSSSKRNDYYLKVQTANTEVYSFDVSQDTYENNEVEKSMRICKRKSVFQFEYWVLHE